MSIKRSKELITRSKLLSKRSKMLIYFDFFDLFRWVRLKCDLKAENKSGQQYLGKESFALGLRLRLLLLAVLVRRGGHIRTLGARRLDGHLVIVKPMLSPTTWGWLIWSLVGRLVRIRKDKKQLGHLPDELVRRRAVRNLKENQENGNYKDYKISPKKKKKKKKKKNKKI